jgi:hypothetical protein
MAAFPNSKALSKKREKLEALIEAAIACLDSIDADCDDEYVLGWSEGETLVGKLGAGYDWHEPTGDERDHDHSEDDFDSSSGVTLSIREVAAIHRKIRKQLACIQQQKVT